MKYAYKIILIVMLLGVAVSLTNISNAAVKNGIYYGDVNMDGKVNSSDAAKVLTMSTNSSKVHALGDINMDGKVNSSDALIIVQRSVGKKVGEYYKVDTYTDSFGMTSILFKQNETKFINEPYPGRYAHGLKGKNEKYIGTWNGNAILTSSRTANPKLGSNGCGPTSCAIVATSFGKVVTPLSLAKTGKCYSTVENITSYFQDLKLNVNKVNYDSKGDNYAKVIKNKGKLIILAGTSGYSSVKGKIGSHELTYGSFHWYTILDVKGSSGKYQFYVGDPYLYSSKSNCGWIDFSNLTGIYAALAITK